jgi:hypothetical protein
MSFTPPSGGRVGTGLPEFVSELNDRIRASAGQFDSSDASTWDFVCECGDPHCREHVGLSLQEFDRARTEHEAVVAARHVREWAEATRLESVRLRAVSEELADENKALRNQARLQLKRAERAATPATALLERARQAASGWRRFANDAIRDAADAYGAETGRLYRFLCECGDLRCRQMVEMTIREYERRGTLPLTNHPARELSLSGRG